MKGEALKSALAALNGNNIVLEYDRAVEGPQTASRLITETVSSFGASFVSALSDADLGIWIGGTGRGTFAFVVLDAKHHSRYRCYACGPRELTAAVMTTAAKF